MNIGLLIVALVLLKLYERVIENEQKNCVVDCRNLEEGVIA